MEELTVYVDNYYWRKKTLKDEWFFCFVLRALKNYHYNSTLLQLQQFTQLAVHALSTLFETLYKIIT